MLEYVVHDFVNNEYAFVSSGHRGADQVSDQGRHSSTPPSVEKVVWQQPVEIAATSLDLPHASVHVGAEAGLGEGDTDVMSTKASAVTMAG